MNYNLHYNKLIERARTRHLDVYCETHHIVPKCLGGDNSTENLVKLTPEEHYVAHQLLIKIYPNNHKLVFAAQMMCVNSPNNQRNNKMYGWLKRLSYNIKKNQKLSDETKDKISKSLKGKRIGDQNTFFNKTHSIETRKKISSYQKGRLKEKLANKDNFTWYHNDYPSITCSRYQLKNLYPELKLVTHELLQVVKGNYKIHKGWRITVDDPYQKIIIKKEKRSHGPMYGKTHSDESKKKMSEKRKGLPNLSKMDKTLYKWQHKLYGVEILCKYDLSKKYHKDKLNSSELAKIVNPKYREKSHKGWICLSKICD